jgi:hypothetical protein
MVGLMQNILNFSNKTNNLITLNFSANIGSFILEKMQKINLVYEKTHHKASIYIQSVKAFNFFIDCSKGMNIISDNEKKSFTGNELDLIQKNNESSNFNIARHITFENLRDIEVVLILEPWAEEFKVQPHEKIELMIKGMQESHREIFFIFHKENILVLYGWTPCTISVYRNGDEIKDVSVVSGNLCL